MVFGRKCVSLQNVLVAATIMLGLCQLGLAYFARSSAAACTTERSIARDATRVSLGFAIARHQDDACIPDPAASTRRH